MTAATKSQSDPYLAGLARAAVGAVLFAVPLMMTMELWQFGFSMDRLRLALFVGLVVPVAIMLSRRVGFRATRDTDWLDDVMDGLSAIFVGFTASAVMLTLFAVITWDQPLREILGKIAVQAVPATIGAVVARKQLAATGDSSGDEDQDEDPGYFGELFLMVVGALFVALNVAPTEEMILIAWRMTPWHALGLALLSITLLHLIVYRVGLPGQETPAEGQGPLKVFLRFSVAGYALVLLASLYILWTFGRTEGLSLQETVNVAVVLGFPAALGAALARLVT